MENRGGFLERISKVEEASKGLADGHGGSTPMMGVQNAVLRSILTHHCQNSNVILDHVHPTKREAGREFCAHLAEPLVDHLKMQACQGKLPAYAGLRRWVVVLQRFLSRAAGARARKKTI